MLSFFSRRRTTPATQLSTDLHSHLLPGIDDGVQTVEESLAVIDQFLELGYKKIITTPHIMADFFGNTYESVTAAFQQFAPILASRGYTIPFHAAAEYYLDETVIDLVKKEAPLLTFGDRYFLFETNMVSEPLQIKEFIFSLTSKGYRPVLAHPERYLYMNLEKAEDLRQRGVLLQINLLSLIGYYGPVIQKLSAKLIENKLVDMLGSDCHNLEHVMLLNKVRSARLYDKALSLPLLNHTL